MKPPRSDFIIIATGTRFGRLVVIGEGERSNGGRGYLCKCDCGNKIVCRPHYLINDRTISCKCARTDRVSKLNKTHGQAGVKTKTTEYRSWASMRNSGAETQTTIITLDTAAEESLFASDG